ncbi:hypothetical protein [Nocardia sp. XZ_19_385]|nr:hypothetical protein [Nocardia sp. XZ_19_385]
MDDDPIDRQALREAGLDADDPQVWAGQRWIQDLLICHGIWLMNWDDQ